MFGNEVTDKQRWNYPTRCSWKCSCTAESLNSSLVGLSVYALQLETPVFHNSHAPTKIQLDTIVLVCGMSAILAKQRSTTVWTSSDVFSRKKSICRAALLIAHDVMRGLKLDLTERGVGEKVIQILIFKLYW